MLLTEALLYLFWVDTHDLRVVSEHEVWNVIRHLGYMDGRLHGRNVLHRLLDDVDPAHVLRFKGFIVLLKQPVDGGDHAYDLFLGDLHTAAYGVAVWIVVGCREISEMFLAEQQAGVLRSADPLATGETDEVIAHAGVLPQIFNRRHVCSGVHVTGN